MKDIMLQDPHVSIVIPTYNRAATLKEALECVYAQSYKGSKEVIVIDDNSTDNTVELIGTEFPDVCFVHLNKNVGPSAARNIGISKAKGDFIAFLDSDDLWDLDYLSSQLSVFGDKKGIYPKKVSVSSTIEWNTVSGRRSEYDQKPNLKRYRSPIHHLFSKGSFVFSPSSIVLPRKFIEDAGVFNESLRFGEDTELYIRLLLSGYKFVYESQTHSIRRKHFQDQAISPENLEKRRLNRIETAEKYYDLVSSKFEVDSMSEIRTQINLYFAREFLANWNLLKWLSLHVSSFSFKAIRVSTSALTKDMSLLLKMILKLLFQGLTKSNYSVG
ncbi:glycosyltransferase family 2 protein [Phormidium tenue]|uniref:glycosyltransferase family 2 protein n=1 Tax=Phormidium tenue TaxID=126344 RepID=UPI001558AF3D|nr:glycosyltransferase family 2 protein [Phormidium tenue]MBD2231994.1 glycosyltransferase family 2 protein [Phormidium tenue FACHB-1052]